METTQAIGVHHFLTHADGVIMSILVLMVLASIASWYLIVTKALAILRARRRGASFMTFFWGAGSLDEVARYLEQNHPDDPMSHLAYHGIIASHHHERPGVKSLGEAGSLADLVTRTLRKTIDEETSRMESGLTTLASVGSTAPFVGLLGTVWGIYHALAAISLSGTGSLDKVAGPVGEALIMTAIGLAVAIPAVLGYNFIVRHNRVISGQLDAFAHDLYAFLVTGAKIEAQPVPVHPGALRVAVSPVVRN
jgi:biopolymer transport protein ExbB